MASGFIYLIILGMWVAYFLPRWISSHDDSSGKTQERYKSAMRTVTDSGSATVLEPTQRMSREAQIHQRRIVFTSIFVSLIIASALTAAGLIAAPILLIPVSGLAIYIAHTRRQIRVSQQKARRIKALATISQARVITEPIEKISLANRPESVEHWVPLSERTDSAGVVVIPKESPSWQPIRIPAPTYVSAPKAIVSQRVIDLTVPGKWLEEQKKLAEEALPSRDDLFDQVLAEEAAKKQDRAVNE
jgi:hypothetical protein